MNRAGLVFPAAEDPGPRGRSAMLQIFNNGVVDPAPVLPPGEPGPRPRFSVIVPTFQPDEKLLAALKSVLAEKATSAEMQIAVVDDASTPGLARSLVHALGAGARIEVVEHRRRLGLGGNWNRCLQVARGELVHLLHQDDYILPGFYAAMDRGFRASPDVGMAFCRSRIIDGAGRSIKSTSRVRWRPGIVPNWLSQIAERQRVQTPAAVVRREVYERVGGFRTDLSQTVDWEMWVRIAAAHPVWYEPRRLAVYRRHPANESARLLDCGAAWPDVVRAIQINALSLPEPLRDAVTSASARWHAASALRTVERLLARGAGAQAAATLARVPDLIQMSGPQTGLGMVRRRLATLRERLTDTVRRAA